MAVQLTMDVEVANAGGLALDKQIRRFGHHLRRELWRHCSHSRKMRDLLVSYPAAAAEIAYLPDGDPVREAALRLVESGASLAEIATVLGLPLWFRKVPPEGLICQLRGRVTPGVLEPGFAAKVLPLMPLPRLAGPWFLCVLAARRAGSEGFAAWLARRTDSTKRGLRSIPIVELGLYAWFSEHPEHEAGRTIKVRWHPRMGLPKAAGEARRWLLTVLEEKCLCGPGAQDDDGPSSFALGYEFVPLRLPPSIVEDGQAMKHCVGQYVGSAICGRCLIYSVRKDGQRIATIELRPRQRGGAPDITQMCGPRNTRVELATAKIAREWVASNRRELRSQFCTPADRHSNEAFETYVWGPYAAALAADPSIAVAPARPTVTSVLCQMRDLWALEK